LRPQFGQAAMPENRFPSVPALIFYREKSPDSHGTGL
jgi:hypothetical protein